jgi:hypothetical protein
MPAIVTAGAQLMARALVTKLRIPDAAAQTRKSPVARSGRAEASCHDISNTWLAHGYSSSSLTTSASQYRPCGVPASRCATSTLVLPENISARIYDASRTRLVW